MAHICTRTVTLQVNAVTPVLYWGFLGDSLNDYIQGEPLVYTGHVPQLFVNGVIDRGIRFQPEAWGFQNNIYQTAITTRLARTGGEILLTAWAKTDVLPIPNLSQTMLWFRQFDVADVQQDVNVAVQFHHDANVLCAGGTYDGTALVGTNWHFYALHISVAGVYRLFIDGVLAITQAGVAPGVQPKGRLSVYSSTNVTADSNGDFSEDEISVVLNAPTIPDSYITYLYNLGFGRTWPY